MLWRAVNPNFGASFAARAVVPAQRTTPLRVLGGTSRGRAFPITDPRIPMANANRKAPALVIEPRVARFGPGRLASSRAVRCQSPPAEKTRQVFIPSRARGLTEPGRVTSFSYDAYGNLLQKTINAGSATRSWSYTYNTAGIPSRPPIRAAMSPAIATTGPAISPQSRARCGSTILPRRDRAGRACGSRRI